MLFNEGSLVYAGDDTVYMLTREPGYLYKSIDNGVTWEHTATEGILHQPGFAKVDNNRAFATWADPLIVSNQRVIMGKMFYFDKGWNETKSKMIYKSSIEGWDMGDPSSTLTADGRLLTVYYDTDRGFIGGTFVDTDKWEYEWLKVTSEETKLIRGETTQLSISGVDDNNYSVDYRSDNEMVATVDGQGLVTAGDRGNANITATIQIDDAIVTRSIQINVFSDPIAPDLVLFDDNFDSYELGSLPLNNWSSSSSGWSVVQGDGVDGGKSLLGSSTNSAVIQLGKDESWKDYVFTYSFKYVKSPTNTAGLITSAVRAEDSRFYNNTYITQPIPSGFTPTGGGVIGTSKIVWYASTPLNKATKNI